MTHTVEWVCFGVCEQATTRGAKPLTICPLSPSPAEDELRAGSETSLRASAGATVTSLIKQTQVLIIFLYL